MFGRRLKILEIKQPVRYDAKMEADGRAAMASLKNHPGFQHLLNKLRLQKAALEAALVNKSHADLKDVLWIQSGIRWMNWIENQFLLAVNAPSETTSRDPNAYEMESLKQALAAIQGVGE